MTIKLDSPFCCLRCCTLVYWDLTCTLSRVTTSSAWLIYRQTTNPSLCWAMSRALNHRPYTMPWEILEISSLWLKASYFCQFYWDCAMLQNQLMFRDIFHPGNYSLFFVKILHFYIFKAPSIN